MVAWCKSAQTIEEVESDDDDAGHGGGGGFCMRFFWVMDENYV